MPSNRENGVRVEIPDLDQFARAFRGADKVIQRSVSKALREVGKPMAAEVIREGADSLPHAGGLSVLIADGADSASVSLSLRGKVTSVSLTLRSGKHDLRSMNNGVLRHPVFGNKNAWVSQSIRENVFTEAFDKHRDEAVKAMEQALRAAADEIAREA